MSLCTVFSLAALLVAVSSAPARDDATPSSLCDNGWVQYQDSCYYTERDNKLPFQQAESKCKDMNANLYVANSLDEYNAIMLNAPFNYWTWMGLYKADETGEAVWDTPNGMDFHNLDWLIKPYGNAVNGWTTISQCAAHWNPSTSIGKYTYWYPCNYSFYYVCERNSTLSAATTTTLSP